MPLRQCQCAYAGAVLETTVLAELSRLESLSKLETQVSWNFYLFIFFGDLSVIFPESQVANDTLEGGFNGPREVLQTQLDTIAYVHCEGENGLLVAGCFRGTKCLLSSWIVAWDISAPIVYASAYTVEGLV